MTKVTPNGTKTTTNIYAGGALIAKQGASGAIWTTADPVTGTTAQFTMINNESVAEVVEESEPLGQTITAISPPEGGQESYLAYKGNVGEPEWQCQIPQSYYGGFDGMPWHCVFADMLKKGLEGEQLWYIVEKPQSPTNVHHGHKSPASAPGTQDGYARLMKYTSLSTTKPMDGEDEDDEDDEPIRISTWTFKFDNRFTAEYDGDDDKVKPAKTYRSPERLKQFRDCLEPHVKTYEAEIDALNLKSINTLDGNRNDFYAVAGVSVAGSNAADNRQFFGQLLRGGLKPGTTFQWKFNRGVLYFGLLAGTIQFWNARATATREEYIEFGKVTKAFVAEYNRCQELYPEDQAIFLNFPQNPNNQIIYDMLNGNPPSRNDGKFEFLNDLLNPNNEKTINELANPFYRRLRRSRILP